MAKAIKTKSTASNYILIAAIAMIGFMQLLMVVGIGGVAYYIYTVGGRPMPPPSSNVAEELKRAIPDSSDLKTFAAQYSVFGDLVAEDLLRSSPVIINTHQLKELMLGIGYANVGPTWNIGERYPQAVDVVENYLRSIGLDDASQELTSGLRNRYVHACEQIGLAGA